MNPHKDKNPYKAPKEHPIIHYANGEPVPNKHQVTYLGIEIHQKGNQQPNLITRLAKAQKEFEKLKIFWNHANLTKIWKLRVFKAIFYPMILYGLHHSCLTQTNLDKLDAWQARQLRRVLKIKASFYSRTPNSTVIKQADTPLLSAIVLRNQIQYLGRILRAENYETIKTITLTRHCNYRTLTARRRRGHPRDHWLPTLVEDIHDTLATLPPSHSLPHPAITLSPFPYAALSQLAADSTHWRRVSELPTRRFTTPQHTPTAL